MGPDLKKWAGAGVVLIDPNGDQLKYMVHLEFKATNNMAEYEALIFGLTQALSLGGPAASGEGRFSSNHQAGPRGLQLQQSPARDIPHPREEAREGLRCLGTTTCSPRIQLSSR